MPMLACMPRHACQSEDSWQEPSPSAPHGSQGTNSGLDGEHFYHLARLAWPVERVLCQSNAEHNEETEMRPLFV